MNRGGNTRGGTRGRGRGGGTSDFKHVALDYDQLSSTSKNFNPTPTALPTPIFAYVPTGPSTPRSYPATPSTSTSQSGDTTPQRSYPSSNRGSRGSTTDRGASGVDRRGRGGSNNRAFTPRGTGFTPRGSTRGGIGGLGFSPRDGGENGMRGINSPGNGYVRPFLVPVAFVKASMLPPGLGGDSSDEDERVQVPIKEEELQPVGYLEDQIHQGALISVIRDLDLHHIGHHLPSLDPEPAEDVLSEEEEDRVVDEQMQRLLITAVPSSPSPATSPETSTSGGIPDKSVSTSRRPVAVGRSPLVIPPNFVLGLSTPAKPTTTTTEVGSDSDSSSSSEEEEEEIVFTPQAIRISTLPSAIPVINPSSSISTAIPIPVKIVEKVLVERMMETIEEPLLITSLSTPLSTRLPAYSQPVSSAPLLPISSEVEIEEDAEIEPEFPSTPFTFNSTSFSIPPPLLDEDDDSSGSDNGKPIVQAKTKQPKLTPSQKRAAKAAGKKARKAGKEHARSGNQHLLLSNALARDFSQEEDEDDLAQGAKMLSAMGLEDVTMEELITGEEEEGEPRVGDSDLEWGSNGPGGRPSGIKETSFRAQGSNRKQRRKAERASQRELERLERLSLGAREEVELALGGGNSVSVLSERERENFPNGTNATDSRRTNRNRNEGMDEAAADYARNILESGGGEEDLSFLLRASLGESQKTIDDLLDEALALEEEGEEGEGEERNGWETTDESESGKDEMDAKRGLGEDESESESESEEEVDSDDELEMDIALGEADAQVDLALAEAEDAFMSSSDLSYSSSSSAENLAIEQALLLGGKIRFSSMGQAGGGGRKGVVEKRRQKKGKGRMVRSSDDDSSDDEEEFGEGGNTWADQDEEYIRGVQEILNDNAELLDSRNRKERKKLFKAIEQGDFRGYDFDDDDFSMSKPSGRKGKGKGKAKFSGAFSAELESQWTQDRAKKGDYKRARALARAEALARSPHLSKKSPKPPAATAGSSNAAVLNLQIREFLTVDISKKSLSLPPMSKKSRVAVHLLSELYGLKSRSLGTGKNRFPVLERTTRSAVYGVDQRRVDAIIGTASGERYVGGGGAGAKGKMGGLWAALSGDRKGGRSGGAGGGGGGGGRGGDPNKNREGEVVGKGADKLGEDNIGYALLKRMGWAEGEQIGLNGGISDPITARIKMGKRGLGAGGFSVTREEAPKMGVAGNGW